MVSTTQRAFRLEKVECPRCGATMAVKTLASQHVCRDLREPRKKRRRAPLDSHVLKTKAVEAAARSFERRLTKLGALEGPFDGAAGDAAAAVEAAVPEPAQDAAAAPEPVQDAAVAGAHCAPKRNE
eukprot:15436699-Alexandrium_andersonii.AAC.1